VSGSEDKDIKLFSLETFKEIHCFERAHKRNIISFSYLFHAVAVLSVTFSLDSKYIISGSDDRSVKVFDLQSKKERRHYQNLHAGRN